MASGFYELQGGTQPATPSAGFKRLWFDTAQNRWKILDSAGNNTLVDLPEGIEIGQVLCWNGTEWIADFKSFDYTRTTEWIEDWGGNSAAGSNNWDSDTAGGGQNSSITAFPISTDKHYGRMRYRITAASNSRAGHDRGSPELSLGAATIKIANSNWFSTEFLDAANNCFFMTGLGSLGSDTTAGVQTDGVYFRVEGEDVYAVCTDGGVSTSQLVYSGLLSERWYRFEIEVNQLGNQVVFRLYETSESIGSSATLLGTQTVATNIPPTSSNLGPFNLLNHNNIAGVATTNDVWQDYFYYKVEYGFER